MRALPFSYRSVVFACSPSPLCPSSICSSSSPPSPLSLSFSVHATLFVLLLYNEEWSFGCPAPLYGSGESIGSSLFLIMDLSRQKSASRMNLAPYAML